MSDSIYVLIVKDLDGRQSTEVLGAYSSKDKAVSNARKLYSEYDAGEVINYEGCTDQYSHSLIAAMIFSYIPRDTDDEYDDISHLFVTVEKVDIDNPLIDINELIVDIDTTRHIDKVKKSPSLKLVKH